MKIKFLKDSPGGTYKKGETHNFHDDWRANYFVKTGQAEKATSSNKERKTSKKAEDKNAAPKTESKSKK